MLPHDLGLHHHKGARSFTPMLVRGSVAWWTRADVATTVAGKVSSWTDRSGNGRHWTQSSSSARPSLVAAAVNGQPAIEFDGSNDILVGPSLAALSGSAMLFAVMKQVADPPASAGQTMPWHLSSNGDEHVPYTDRVVYSAAFSTARKTVGTIGAAGYWSSQYRIVGIRSAANDFRFYSDGVEQYSTGTNTFFAEPTPALGGDPHQPVFRGRVFLAETICYSPAPSAQVEAYTWDYLGWRYGISVP